MFWQKGMWIFIFGGSGALSRYWLSGLIYKFVGHNFPYGTFIVNITGCFLFGLIFEMAEQRMLISPEMRIIILTGFMGAFTTFSSFIFECAQLFKDGQWLLGGCNLIGEIMIGFLGLYLGYLLAKLI
ncbi:camphor resistance protein CrcB [Desulfonauticus submarinus]|uniref:Fluoride-specific ion channel FluC n=1 Tax=Desulfonauticus submarinus TaxID=206665 RepID=A0A1G9ZK28_9BACT|nr:fluoride efflux transporter CrcB [Desulfonauticus submarinus]SDN21689.1 camphor resistance protein CrcB [Desulfonauticus submarinus]